MEIDSPETIQKVTSNMVTFKEQSKIWLAGIADGSIVSRKSREQMKPATVSAYQSCVGFLNDPTKGNIADAVLADFNNGEAKKLIARMKALKPKLSNKTIVTYFQTVRASLPLSRKMTATKCTRGTGIWFLSVSQK